LFLQNDLATVPISEFPTIYRLYRAGWRELSDEQNLAMGKAVAARQDDWTGRSYEENLSKVMLMDWEDIPFERMSQDVISFFDAGGKYEDISTHAQVSSFNRVGNTPRFREENVGA